jgi:hypothetical protein
LTLQCVFFSLTCACFVCHRLDHTLDLQVAAAGNNIRDTAAPMDACTSHWSVFTHQTASTTSSYTCYHHLLSLLSLSVHCQLLLLRIVWQSITQLLTAATISGYLVLLPVVLIHCCSCSQHSCTVPTATANRYCYLSTTTQASLSTHCISIDVVMTALLCFFPCYYM